MFFIPSIIGDGKRDPDNAEPQGGDEPYCFLWGTVNVFAYAVEDLVKVGGGLGVLRHLAGEGEGGGVAETPAALVAACVGSAHWLRTSGMPWTLITPRRYIGMIA
jgi:hypothetical protein